LKGNPKKLFWGKEQYEAFNDLKRRFISAPILGHFNSELDKVVETDVSNYGLGCILSESYAKRLHPVPFHSRKLSPVEGNYDIYEKRIVGYSRCLHEMETLLARNGETNNRLY